jgi:hypothetical protein
MTSLLKYSRTYNKNIPVFLNIFKSGFKNGSSSLLSLMKQSIGKKVGIIT